MAATWMPGFTARAWRSMAAVTPAMPLRYSIRVMPWRQATCRACAGPRSRKTTCPGSTGAPSLSALTTVSPSVRAICAQGRSPATTPLWRAA